MYYFFHTYYVKFSIHMSRLAQHILKMMMFAFSAPTISNISRYFYSFVPRSPPTNLSTREFFVGRWLFTLRAAISLPKLFVFQESPL